MRQCEKDKGDLLEAVYVYHSQLTAFIDTYDMLLILNDRKENCCEKGLNNPKINPNLRKT